MSRQLPYGIKKYREFHALEPNEIEELSAKLTIPKRAYCLGYAKEILYHSKKWNDPANYIHEHKENVKIAVPYKDEEGYPVSIPQWIWKCEVLVKLGDCIGFSYLDHEGELMEAGIRKPYPRLYCTPNGKALLIVSGSKRSRYHVEGIIWGGDLHVEDRGIVG